MAELDKFKRRLIRSVSRLLLEEKKSEEDVWEHLNKETRCDCKLLWERMRAITIKKIKRLLPADDRPSAIPGVARLSFTDWLLFDLVLVHENIDVIDRDRMQEVKGQWKSLMDLFALVQRFNIESLGGTQLAEAWSSVALAYNISGRQCSPMMLQYRWYQLKELTRSNFYNLWVNYRGNNKLWESAQQYTPSKLQMAIAKRYPQVVTQPFPKWEELIQQQKVVLPEEFGMIKNKGAKPEETDSDLIMVEPVIETIDLGRDSDSEETDQNQDDPSNEPSPSPTDDNDDDLNDDSVDIDLTIVKSEPEVDGLSNVQIIDATGSGEGKTISEDIDKQLEQQSQLLKAKRNLALEMSEYIEATEELFTENLDNPAESETIEDLCDGDTVDNDEVTESTDELIRQKANAFLSGIENEEVDESAEDLIQQKANAFLSRKENEKVKEATEDKHQKTNAVLSRIENESTDDLIQQKANAFLSRKVNESTDDLIQQKTNAFLSRIENKEVNESTEEHIQPTANAILRTEKVVNIIEPESIQELFDDETFPVDDDDQAVSSESTENDLKADSTEDLIKRKANEFITRTEKNVQNPVTEIDEDSDEVDDIIKQKADDFINKTDAKKPVEDSAVTDLGLSSDNFVDEGIEYVDDGIEFVDDGIEYVDDDDDDTHGAGDDLQKPLKTETENAEEPQPAEDPASEDLPKFDLKLLMEPVVYTVKLDNMKVFEGSTFHTVRDKDSIDSILVESKPVSKLSVVVKVEPELIEENNVKDSIDSILVENKPVSKLSVVVKAEPEHFEENNVNDDKMTDIREETINNFGNDNMSQVHEKTSDNFGNDNMSHVHEETSDNFGDDDVHEDANDSGDNSESSEEEIISDEQKVKVSSYLLQKPRSRNYNPIQLCKNPDFNTRLKRLTAGFFSSPRNCQLIKACKPMTIDLHKAFERKLVNGTIYLKSDGKSLQPVEEDNHSKQTTSVLPSAMPIQSLINNTVMDINELVGLTKTSAEDTVDLTNKLDAEKAERNKVINLRDITEIRRINQKLLTAEVTPIQVQHNDNINVPYKQQTIVTHICNEDVNPTNLEPKETQLWNVPKQTAKRTSILIDKLPPDRAKTVAYKKIGRPAIKTDKSVKTKTMPVYSQMTREPVAWNKRIVQAESARNLFNDSLITIDTLNKMIVKLSGFEEYKPTNKKKRTTWVMDRPRTESSNVAEKIDVPKKVDTYAKKPRESRKKKFCCWCSEKKDKMCSKQRVKLPHNCPLPLCNCCCRDQLIDALKEENLRRSNMQIPVPPMDNMIESIESVVQQSAQTPVPTPLLRVYNQHRNSARDPTQSMESNSNLASPCGQKTLVEAVLNTDLAQTLVVDSDNVDSNVGFINEPEANDADTIISQEVVINFDQSTFVSNGPQETFESNSQNTFNSQQPQTDQNQLRPVFRINITTESPKRKKMYVPVPGSSQIRKVATTSTETQTMPIPQNTETESIVRRRRALGDNSAKILLDGSNSIPVPRTVIHNNETPRNDKVIYLSNQNFSNKPVNSPICLGKNKILLTTVKFPRQFEPIPETVQNPKVIPTLPLPEGVLLVMLPNGELSYTVEPGVELDDAQLAALPNIIAAVKQQINTIPAQPADPPSQDVIEIPGDDDDSPPSENTAEKPVKPANISLECNETLANKSDDNQTSAEQTTNVTDVSLETVDNCESLLPELVSNEEQTLNKTTESVDLNTSRESNEIIEINECVQSVDDNLIINANKEEEKSIESAGTSRKSLLSDLMEMSGISAEDTSTHEVAPVEPVSTIPIPGPATAVCTETQPEFQNVECLDSAVNMTDALQTASDVVNLPELTPITSLAELKYACENNGLFFKLDLDTGLIVPINVCIKRRPKPIVPQVFEKTVIDLTDDSDNTIKPLKLKAAACLSPGNTNLPKIAPKFMTLSTIMEQRKTQSVKPLKLFKAVHPAILKRSTVTVTGNKENPIRVRRTFIKQKRKSDKVDVKIDLVDSDAPMEEEYLVNSSDSENDESIPGNVINKNTSDEKNPADSDDSDDEPLAKKVKRQTILNENVDNYVKNINTEKSAVTQDGPQPEEAETEEAETEEAENEEAENEEAEPMDVPSEMPAEYIDSINTEEEPDIEPALDFMEYDSDGSQDDCILGV